MRPLVNDIQVNFREDKSYPTSREFLSAAHRWRFAEVLTLKAIA